MLDNKNKNFNMVARKSVHTTTPENLIPNHI